MRYASGEWSGGVARTDRQTHTDITTYRLTAEEV